MKTKSIIILLIILFLKNFFLFSNNILINDWYGNSNFIFSKDDDYLSVSMNKKPWENFTLKVNRDYVLNNPIFDFDIFSNDDLILKIELSDGFRVSDGHIYEFNSTNNFQNLKCDFSDCINNFNSNNIYIVFYVNPGKDYVGELKINVSSYFNQYDNEQSDIKIYPIPAQNYLNIEFTENDFNSIEIIDINGKLVYKFILEYTSNFVKILVDDLPRGTFIIRLIGKDYNNENKIVLI